MPRNYTAMEISLKVTKAETEQVKRLTDCRDPRAAIAKLVTLAGRGRVFVRPSKAAYRRALGETLREEAAGKLMSFKSGSAAMRHIRRKVAE